MSKMKIGTTVAALVMTLGASFAVYAQDNSNSTETKLKDVNPAANKVQGAEDVDDVLTNANLRAMSGSTSRWSIASSFTYDGGTMAAPFAESRPNIAGASATSTDTDLNGQLNIKFNINSFHSLLLGFGIRKMAPFVTSGPSKGFYDQGGKDMDAFDPTFTYQYIYKLGVIQSVLQVGLVQYTRQDIASSQGGNLNQGLSLDQENIIDIGTTGLSVGGSIGVAGNSPTDSSVDYSRLQYWFAPYAEYKLTEKVNLRTVSNLWMYEFYPQSGWTHDTVTQSVGVGFSVTRDIFLYPNVQFLPDHVTAGLTNVGVTATVNLF